MGKFQHKIVRHFPGIFRRERHSGVSDQLLDLRPAGILNGKIADDSRRVFNQHTLCIEYFVPIIEHIPDPSNDLPFLFFAIIEQ